MQKIVGFFSSNFEEIQEGLLNLKIPNYFD